MQIEKQGQTENCSTRGFESEPGSFPLVIFRQLQTRHPLTNEGMIRKV